MKRNAFLKFTCDVCGKEYFAELSKTIWGWEEPRRGGCEKELERCGWAVVDGKHYCPGCVAIERLRAEVDRLQLLFVRVQKAATDWMRLALEDVVCGGFGKRTEAVPWVDGAEKPGGEVKR